MTRRTRAAGFSIIELSIAVSIAGLLLALGLPSFSGYLQNARLGALAQGMYTGLQTARTQAVSLNQNVQFVLTNSSLETATADTVVLDPTGRNWVVRYYQPGQTVYTLIEKKASNSSDVGNVAIAASAASFTFNSLGAASGVYVTQGIALTNPVLGACTPAGPVRCWSVVVAPGGQVRLCSPDSSLATSDTRHC